MRIREHPDHYAILQVTPRASRDEIAAAYERLRELYSAERTVEAAPDLQALVAQKRQQLEQAYAVLADAVRREAYDRRHGFAQGALERDELDYRPLPPARGQERNTLPSVAERPQPARAAQKRAVRGWLPALAIGSALLAVLLVLLLSGVRTTSGPTALATPTISGVSLPYTDVQINLYRTQAAASNTAEAWIEFGNAVFDNLQTLREQARQSPQYRGLLGGWLDAAEAYGRALAIVDNATVRADRALALFNYGQDAPDPQRVAEALAEVERGIIDEVAEPRALISYGLILSQVQPPRRAEAFAQWRKVRELAPQSPEAQTAERLLQSYGQS